MISIIVPVYKVEDYLDFCIQSILNQTIKEIELILVNDGSPDRCPIICEYYTKIDPRVKVIHKKHEGVAVARNIGLKAVKGDYIAFVDGDDFVRNNMYETLLKELKIRDADFIKSDFVEYNDGDKIIIENRKTCITEFTPLEAVADFINTGYSNRKTMKSTLCDGLYKRECFFVGDALKIQFPTGQINEDTYVFPELIFNAKKILYINEAFYYYRKRKNSIVHSGICLAEIESRHLWEHIGSVIAEYTEQYQEICDNNSIKRYLTILKRIYYSDLKKEYFDMVRKELLTNVVNGKKILDKQMQRTLKIIKCYPLYLLLKKIFWNSLY